MFSKHMDGKDDLVFVRCSVVVIIPVNVDIHKDLIIPHFYRKKKNPAVASQPGKISPIMLYALARQSSEPELSVFTLMIIRLALSLNTSMPWGHNYSMTF